MTWHALHYPLRPGSEETVKDLFRRSGRPNFDVTDDDGTVVGRLLGTMAFVGDGKAIRVMEVEGALPKVAAHMSRQPEVRAFEDELEDHLAVPRDMRTPDGAREFFQQAALGSVHVVGGEQGEPQEWTGLFHQVLEGHEDDVRELASHTGRPDLTVRGGDGAEVGQVRGMMFFVGRGKAMRLVRISGQASAFSGHMSRQPVARKFQEALTPHLAVDRDMDSPEDAGRYFAKARLECVLSRRHDQEV